MSDSPAQLPNTLPTAAFIPFLIASIIVAAAYGTSFLLPEYLRAQGFVSGVAGGVISIGMISTIVCCCLAGWIAQRVGVMHTITLATVAMSISMLSFACVPWDARATYLGGLMLGVGWSVFYILAPLQIINYLCPASRLRYLTIMSGAQMAGLGLAAPLGHFMVREGGGYTLFYAFLCVACIVSVLCLLMAGRVMSGLPQSRMSRVSLRPVEVVSLLRSRATVPIIMIVLGACIFAGLSTFQASYAESRQLSPDNFFVTFTLTSVILRFSLARSIGRLRLDRLAIVLFVFTSASLSLFLLNDSNMITYVLATIIFAIGYGLTYSTLNIMAVNQAEAAGLSPSVTSQVFTLGYFIGLFGFPSLGGAVMMQWGIDWVLVLLLGASLSNLLLLVVSVRKNNMRLA